MKIACDFCGNPQVKYKFPNPEIRNAFLGADFPEGYFLACIECTILLEDKLYARLAQRASNLPRYWQYQKDREQFQSALFSVYRRISRQREPF